MVILLRAPAKNECRVPGSAKEDGVLPLVYRQFIDRYVNRGLRLVIVISEVALFRGAHGGLASFLLARETKAVEAQPTCWFCH